MTVIELIEYLETHCDPDKPVQFQGSNEWTEDFIVVYVDEEQTYQIVGV